MPRCRRTQARTHCVILYGGLPGGLSDRPACDPCAFRLKRICDRSRAAGCGTTASDGSDFHDSPRNTDGSWESHTRGRVNEKLLSLAGMRKSVPRAPHKWGDLDCDPLTKGDAKKA